MTADRLLQIVAYLCLIALSVAYIGHLAEWW